MEDIIGVMEHNHQYVPTTTEIKLSTIRKAESGKTEFHTDVFGIPYVPSETNVVVVC